METIYVKSSPAETLKEHTQQCILMLGQMRHLYENLLSPQEWELLTYAVKIHDVGKVDWHYQNTIRKEMGLSLYEETGEEVKHNYISPAYIQRQYFMNLWNNAEIWYQLLICCIYYHHAHEIPNMSAVGRYIQNVLHDNPPPMPFHEPFLKEIPDQTFLKYIDIRNISGERLRLRYMLIKGMMNRIDCAACAHLQHIDHYNGSSEIGLTTQKYLMKHGYEIRPVQNYLFTKREENVIVCAAAGTGKTDGALLWCWDSKAFYTVPVRGSVNSIFLKIRDEIGYGETGLLRSDERSYYMAQKQTSSASMDSGEIFDLYKQELAHSFAYPLTVCTIDQLLKFIFKANGTEIYASVLAGIKLVIDELQSYSPELVGGILYALEVMTKYGGKFAIITSSFPKCLYGLMAKYEIPVKPAEPVFHSEFTKRHRIRLLDSFPIADILKQSASHKVLVICNTVKKAQELYGHIAGQGVPVYLQHSNFLRKDRVLLEKRVLEFAANRADRSAECGIWICTQVIETASDVDFDILYTEANTIDALIQRMGRIYRNRCYDMAEEPNVYIVNGYEPFIDGQIYDFTIEALQQYDGMLLEESDEIDHKTELMDMVYDESRNPEIKTSRYYKTIESRLIYLQDLHMYEVSKEEVADAFRDIDSIIVMPKDIYRSLCESGKLREWLDIAGNPRQKYETRIEAKENIMAYTIPISEYHRLSYEKTTDPELYHKCGVYLIDAPYDFDTETCTGKGLLRKDK